MKTEPRGISRILCSVALISATHTAHAASDAVAQVYSDAKELTIDLIEFEAANSGASFLVCRAPEFMLYYFPSTLQTMRKPPLNVDALGKAARADAAELAGDWVRRSVDAGKVIKLRAPPQEKADPSKPSQSLMEVAEPKLGNKAGLEDLQAKCDFQSDEVKHEDLQGILRKLLEYRQEQIPKPLNDCAGPYTDSQGVFVSDKAQSCELGLAVRSAVMGDAKATQAHLVGALMVPATTRVKGNYEDWSQMRDTALSVLSASEAKYADELRGAFANVKGGAPIQAELRELAAHIRTTIQANGSAVALQQLLVSALSRSRVFLTPEEVGKVNQAMTVIQSQQFLELLEAMKSGDGHRVIIEAIDTGALALSEVPANSLTDRQRAGIKVGLSVLRYATEVHANQTAAESTRAAAKEALFAYLSENGKAGYGSRKTHWGWEWLTASIGASFSPGYVNSDVQGLRTPVSVEAFVGKWGISQKQWSYVGLHLSALNALGSVAEIALRDPSKSYGHEGLGRMLGLMAHPRLDLVYGVPAFSRKLALFAGIGLTVVAPIKLSDGSYSYEWIFDRPKDSGGEFYPRFFDATVGIRLYPF